MYQSNIKFENISKICEKIASFTILSNFAKICYTLKVFFHKLVTNGDFDFKNLKHRLSVYKLIASKY